MSKPQGGPPRGAYGPGQTVLDPQLAGEAPRHDAGYPGLAPTTVRDPAAAFAPAYTPPPPHASPHSADFARIPPPPPGRRRAGGKRGGASLLAVGVVSFFVIGAGATTLAVLKSTSGDDKPTPTVDVPAPATVPRDPGGSPVGADPPPPPTRQLPRMSPRNPSSPRNPNTKPPGRPPHPPRYPGGPNSPRPPRSSH